MPATLAQPRTARPRPGARPTGWTLIEVLVVIGVLAILIGVVAVGTARMRQGSKISQTNALLHSLDSIAGEYKVLT
jgi:prepilin-type N-terminal cleavage/methylation domain-containing protein